MRELLPYTALVQPVRVFGDLTFIGRRLRLAFELNDPHRQVKDSLRPAKPQSWGRADELWKTTCFECFLAEPGKPGYWEVNLSPHLERCALYRFEGYRSPQPPQVTRDFEIENVTMTPTSLSCELNSVPFNQIEAALTAVIRTADGLSYFSLKHSPDKPDFHWRGGFILTVCGQ